MEMNSLFWFYTLFYDFSVESIVIPVCLRILIHFILAWFYIYMNVHLATLLSDRVHAARMFPIVLEKKTERAVEKICNFFAICICARLYLSLNILQ